MSIYALREAFYDASQEQEKEALKTLVSAYHKARNLTRLFFNNKIFTSARFDHFSKR